MVFNIFTRLCSLHLSLTEDIFIISNRNPVPISSHSSFQTLILETTDLLSVSMGLPILDISCQRNHTVCDLWLLSLTVFSEFPRVASIIFFVHSSADGHLSYFHFFGYYV